MSATLIVTAMPREAAGLGHGAVACGAGERAAPRLEALLRERTPALVVIAGVCGGLDPSLGPGDLVLARRVLSPDGGELSPRRDVFEAARRAMRARRLAFVSSALLTQPRPAATREEKTDLWNAHGAAGVDMETYAMARIAEAAGVPWLALRAVLERVAEPLPRSLRAWDGDADAAVARGAAMRPWEWPAYVRLALQMRRAMRSLRAALPPVLSAEASFCADGAEVPLVARA